MFTFISAGENVNTFFDISLSASLYTHVSTVFGSTSPIYIPGRKRICSIGVLRSYDSKFLVVALRDAVVTNEAMHELRYLFNVVI